jgi:uncharacterized protein (DUF58 family)
MARPRQLRLTRVGLYYTVVFLAVLIGAVSRQLNLLMLVGCVMAGPLLFSFLYGRWMLRSLAVERRLPAHLHVDERLRVDVSLANRGRRFAAWAVRVEDAVLRDCTRASESSAVGVFFPLVAAGETKTVAYEGQLPRRGRYRFGPLRVSTRFPLGFVRHSELVSDGNDLMVHPKLGRLNPGWLKMIREHESGSQQTARRGLLEADFYGLREWRPGDSRRWIHWRTSARRGTLVVRQFEQRRSQNLALLVDLWQPARPTDEDLNHVETAISLVATLIAESCRKPGAQLHVEVAAQEPLQNAGSGSPVFLREQMDGLSLAAAHSWIEFPARLGHALALIPTATPTFLISTRPIDWDGLRKAASERETNFDGRKILPIDVTSSELTRFYHS